jgi:3-dehydroquinate synthase
MPPRAERARARRIDLSADTGRSTILVGAGVIADAGRILRRRLVPGRAAIVSTPRVARLYARPLAARLRAAGFAPALLVVPDGERAKTLACVAKLYDGFLDAGLDRTSVVVALGGGALSDAAAFAASTFHRGLTTVLVPTTLLSQVDAAVGGKTGVNLPAGKNLVGTFQQPLLVLSDPNTLRTLPRADLRAGFAEVVKIAAVRDVALFRRLEREAPRLLAAGPRELAPIVARAVRLKADIVAADPRDRTGRRAILNYGHTVGHALEALAQYRRLRHGEAVAIGIAAAARIAVAARRLAPGEAERQVALLRALGLPTRVPPGFSARDIMHRIGFDKKAAQGRTPFVLTPRVGSASVVRRIPSRIVLHVLREMGADGRGVAP